MKLSIFYTLSILCLSATASEPNCQYFGPTIEEQVKGYMSSGLAIISAMPISENFEYLRGSNTRFKVEEVWKDHTGVLKPEIKVFTHYPKTLQYSKGEIYLMYLTVGGGRQLHTNICMGTKNINDVSEIEWRLISETPKK